MKKIRKIITLVFIIAMCSSMNAYAKDFDWNLMPGHHNQSVLLNAGEKTSKDTVYFYGRGEILSSGSVEISNNEDGTIYISVDTSAHRNVDRIFHTVFLDQWDDSRQDWKQVDYFEFEATKAENSNLSLLINSFTVSGYPYNKYYRVRGLHAVELGDDIEGCATETDGVFITKK